MGFIVYSNIGTRQKKKKKKSFRKLLLPGVPRKDHEGRFLAVNNKQHCVLRHLQELPHSSDGMQLQPPSPLTPHPSPRPLHLQL